MKYIGYCTRGVEYKGDDIRVFMHKPCIITKLEIVWLVAWEYVTQVAKEVLKGLDQFGGSVEIISQ